jgi:hypothetical protein
MVDNLSEFDDCVEAKITGIEILSSSRVMLSLFSYRSGEGRISAEGVTSFLVSEFREQNIIDRILVWNSESEPAEYRDVLRALISGKDSSSLEVVAPVAMQSASTDIRSGKKQLMFLEAVYGAEIMLLAEKFSLSWK